MNELYSCTRLVLHGTGTSCLDRRCAREFSAESREHSSNGSRGRFGRPRDAILQQRGSLETEGTEAASRSVMVRLDGGLESMCDRNKVWETDKKAKCPFLLHFHSLCPCFFFL